MIGWDQIEPEWALSAWDATAGSSNRAEMHNPYTCKKSPVLSAREEIARCGIARIRPAQRRETIERFPLCRIQAFHWTGTGFQFGFPNRLIDLKMGRAIANGPALI